MMFKVFSDALIKASEINHNDLCIVEKKINNSFEKPFYEAFLDLGFVKKDTIYNLLETISGFQYIDIEKIDIDYSYIDDGDIKELLEAQSLPFKKQNNAIHVAMSEPYNIITRDRVKKVLSKYNKNIEFYISDRELILKHLDKKFKQEKDCLLSKIIKKSLKISASDIHFDPKDDYIQVRARVDGLLSVIVNITKEDWKHLKNIIKVSAKLDIAESRRPQSGHAEFLNFGKRIDLRVSTHPTICGESIAIRILDREKKLISIDKLGFHKSQIEILKNVIRCQDGILLLCGPTGSGKTTTLHSLLQQLDHEKLNIMTLEDPIEYRASSIKQTEIGVITFSDGVKSLLRQDPDIMLIGEIRDEKTAKMAFRAALTGHLVFTTLHAPNALSVPDRLKDFGVPDHLIFSYVRAVVAQRLIRKLCNYCSKDNHEKNGCEKCFNSGYKGRTLLAELLRFENLDNERFMNEYSKNNRLSFDSNTFFSMKDHARYIIEKKITDAEEASRVLGVSI